MAHGRTVKVNRAPVLTLWAAVVAERLGFRPDEALTLGRAVAGLNAYTKGVALGLIQRSPSEVTARKERAREGETLHVELLRRAVPVVQTPEGVRALSKERPISPASVERYLEGKFGEALGEVRAAMVRLARSLPPEELARRAYELYEAFRPAVPAGERGWGAAGILDLARVEALANSG
jgi:hypothetical protein